MTAPHIAALEVLKAENEQLRMQLAAAESEARLSAEKLARIEHELAQLKRLVFGVKSERFEGAAAAGQASLFGGDVPAANVAPHASETVTRSEEHTSELQS